MPQYSGSSRLVCPKTVVVVAIAAAAVVVVVVVVVVIVVVVAAAAVVAVAEAVVVNYSFFQAGFLIGWSIGMPELLSWVFAFFLDRSSSGGWHTSRTVCPA